MSERSFTVARSTRERRVARRREAADALQDFDTQLMLRVREGDREAANTLIRRQFGRVSRYIARIVREERAVEDLTQDVFLSVFAHAGDYEPAAKFATWLYAIATNRALNHLKLADARRQVKGVLEDGARAVPDRSDQRPDRRLRSIHGLIRDVLREAPAEQRRWLESLPGDARALELYKIVKLRYAERLAGL